jgi:hypothetical protein
VEGAVVGVNDHLQEACALVHPFRRRSLLAGHFHEHCSYSYAEQEPKCLERAIDYTTKALPLKS